jgi:hypothetical protein
VSALRGFGMTFDLTTGGMRNWYVGADGVTRWADNEEPVSGMFDDIPEPIDPYGCENPVSQTEGD